MKKIILLLLLVVAVASCFKEPWRERVHYSLSGSVKNIATDMPLQGVKVELEILDGILGIVTHKGKEVLTDSRGEFNIHYVDERENLLYFAQLSVTLIPNEKYQRGVIANNEEHCRSYFKIDEKGHYEIWALPHPTFRLQGPTTIPGGWESGKLLVQLSMLNPNCSDTLLVENAFAHLNNPMEMSKLSEWRILERSNSVTIKYSLEVENQEYYSKQIIVECAYGGETTIELGLE